jgi:hypothetical protein
VKDVNFPCNCVTQNGAACLTFDLIKYLLKGG